MLFHAYNKIVNSNMAYSHTDDFLTFFLFSNLDAIVKTLRADGKVLLPVDTAGRVLELILILEQVCPNTVLFLSGLFSAVG